MDSHYFRTDYIDRAIAEAVYDKQTLALMIDDIERLTGVEFGQTEDRRIYVKPFPPM